MSNWNNFEFSRVSCENLKKFEAIEQTCDNYHSISTKVRAKINMINDKKIVK